MEWLVASAALNLVLIVVASLFFKAIKNIALENLRLRDRLIATERKLIAENLLRTTMQVPKEPEAFDSRTNDLLKLAVRSNNEHEARTAALQACRRIYKKANG